MARFGLLYNCLASAKSGPRFKCCVRALQNSLIVEVLNCVQVSEWRAVFIKESQEKVDFFISRASGKCVYYKQVESYKGGTYKTSVSSCFLLLSE